MLGGVSQPVIARYETGDFFPSYPILIKIADYFNVSADYLLGRTDNPAGKLYAQAESKERADDFIEMCFDPTTQANARLKEMLRKMIEEKWIAKKGHSIENFCIFDKFFLIKQEKTKENT